MSVDKARKDFEAIINQTIKPLGAEEATVNSVNVTDHTVRCTGHRTHRFYEDITYVPIFGSLENGIIATPEVDTIVIVFQMDRDSAFVVASGKISQLLLTSPLINIFFVDEYKITDEENVELKITPDTGMELTMSDVDFKVNNDGMKLTVGANDHKTGWQDLKTAFGTMTFNSPNGPTSIAININAINAAIDKILNTLQ